MRRAPTTVRNNGGEEMVLESGIHGWKIASQRLFSGYGHIYIYIYIYEQIACAIINSEKLQGLRLEK